MIINLS